MDEKFSTVFGETKREVLRASENLIVILIFCKGLHSTINNGTRLQAVGLLTTHGKAKSSFWGKVLPEYSPLKKTTNFSKFVFIAMAGKFAIVSIT